MKKGLLAVIIIIGALALGAFAYTCNPVSNRCFATGGNNTNNTKEKIVAKHLSPNEFKDLLDSGDYKLIDVRTIEEYNDGHLKNSELIDFYKTSEFESYINSLDKNGKYLIYCRRGNRSDQALNIMKQKGFKNVSDLEGGYTAWTATGLPVEK